MRRGLYIGLGVGTVAAFAVVLTAVHFARRPIANAVADAVHARADAMLAQQSDAVQGAVTAIGFDTAVSVVAGALYDGLMQQWPV